MSNMLKYDMAHAMSVVILNFLEEQKGWGKKKPSVMWVVKCNLLAF